MKGWWPCLIHRTVLTAAAARCVAVNSVFMPTQDIHSQLEGIGTENPAATQFLQWMLQILTMVDQISETLVVRGSCNLFQHEKSKWVKTWGADFELLLFNVSTALTLSGSVSGQYVNLWSHPPPCLVFLTLADHHFLALYQENYHFQGYEYQKINQEIQNIDLDGL